MENTPNLTLPYLMPSQAQKHVTHNEALQMLDAIVQLSVIDRQRTAPPAAPTDGDRYIVANGGSAAWNGWDGCIASFIDGGWMRLMPHAGWRCWVEEEKTLLVWDEAGWLPVQVPPDTLVLKSLGIRTTPDSYNRLAVKSDAVLFSHDDVTPGNGNVLVAINKADAAKEAAIFFQNNWSSRAGIGCFGSDRFQIKVSADSSAWSDALSIDPSTGNVGIGVASPSARLQVGGSLSKTSGSFDIAHPDPAFRETHRLRHCFVEAPTRGENIYRFEVDAKAGGTMNIPLPGYWRHLNENPQVWVSPAGHFGRAYCSVTTDATALALTCEAAGRYNVLLIATRCDEDARNYFDPLGVEYECLAGASGPSPMQPAA